jgi:FtsP/CotA-like multicopper oxidase with cupredoxin domain
VRLPRGEVRNPLIRPPERDAAVDRLIAVAGRTRVAPGRDASVWTVSDGEPQPSATTLRLRTGDEVALTFENQLAEATILHWHGLSVPEAADGHPRLAIAPGERYRYEFPVVNRAGTYWYHAHPHHRTAIQVYRGMAGLLLVADADEDRLTLPSGDREIPLLIHDRRMHASGEYVFEPVMHDQMEGWFGDTPFANGVPQPTVEVDAALYRLRVVNASGARILRLALSNGASMTLVGSDGGLLPAPVTVGHVDLATGERADLLVDFSTSAVGERVVLRSDAFEIPGAMAMGPGMGRMMAGGIPQGGELALVEFVVRRAVRDRPWVAVPFPAIERLDPASADRIREFRFESAMRRHTINGLAFEEDRIDIEVPFGSTEVWRLVNESPLPHPVHLHEVQFQVVARRGGRNRVLPWESGWKDTVLVYPGETVDVIATFDRHRGRYLMHCHNLMHEDMGMMLNYEIG